MAYNGPPPPPPVGLILSFLEAPFPMTAFSKAPDECYACQGNQGVYYPPPGIAQQAPLIPGPLVSVCTCSCLFPLLCNEFVKTQMLNNGTIGRHDAPSLPTGNVAGAFQDIPGLALPGTSAAEDLKYLAIRYLRNPDSHVDKLRMKSSRSGGYKVLILLEIDDMM